MNTALRTFSLSASAIGVALLVSACGGGDAEPPPDTDPPTLAITDNVSAATATGPVTFTFTFSEDVGSSFVLEDIAVTGGTAGTLAKSSDTVYTLVVTPPADTAGTLAVAVAAAKYRDLSNNDNVVESSASQAFSTVVTPPPSGNVVLASFDEATPPAVTEFGGAGYAIEVGPTGGGSGNALKITRNGGDDFAGAWVAIPAIPNDAGTQTVSALVYSPTAGIPFVAKAEFGANQGTGDVQANEAVVVGWQTLTWTFTNLAAPNVYNRFTILPNLSTVDTAKDYYIDDITLAASSGGGSVVSTLPITFDDGAVAYTLTGFEGAEDSTLAADPAGGSNMVAKVVRAAGGPWYGGTTVSTGANASIATIPFAANATTMTMRVYSPGPGMRVRMKVENASNVGITVETDAVTVGTGWETLTFDFANPGLSPPVTGGPTAALNVNQIYNKLSVFFNIAAAGGNWAGTYYFDDIAFGGASGGGGGTVSALTFSTGFAAGNRTVEGGEFGGFSGSDQDSFNCTGGPAFCGGGGEFSPAVSAADSYFFYYYQTPTPASALYAGIYVQAPGVTGGLSPSADTAGVQLAGQTKVKFNFNPNLPWFQSTTNNFMVQLDMGKLYTVGGNPCHVQLRRVVTPTAAASTPYALNLSSFVIVQDCAAPGLTAASVLASQPISQISFQAAGGGSAVGDGTLTTGANLSVADGSVYPTTLVLKGGISFE